MTLDRIPESVQVPAISDNAAVVDMIEEISGKALALRKELELTLLKGEIQCCDYLFRIKKLTFFVYLLVFFFSSIFFYLSLPALQFYLLHVVLFVDAPLFIWSKYKLSSLITFFPFILHLVDYFYKKLI